MKVGVVYHRAITKVSTEIRVVTKKRAADDLAALSCFENQVLIK